MSPVVTMESVSFAYGRKPVLDSVSLDLHAGEIVCLLGPNGAGKSTLIRLLTGALSPKSGTVRGVDHGVGLVPQDIALYPWLTAAENCRAFARYAGLSRQEATRAVDSALTVADCTRVADVQVRRLSGGFQRRVNIAVALLTRPRLLILDEPTVGVDLEARQQIAQIIRRVRDDGTAVLLVTHDFDEADHLADWVAFLHQGRVAAAGQPGALVDHLFPDQKRIEIVLSGVPEPRVAAALRNHAATPTGQATIWQSFQAIDAWDPGPFAEALARDGIAFTELRLRKPGVQSLYSFFCLDRLAA